jgi:ATP-dependent RNA helicase DHX37/DHR1
VRAQSPFFDVSSDALTAMRAAGAFEFALRGGKHDVGMAAWCGERRVMYRVLKEMHDLREQLTAAAADVIEEGPVRERLLAGVDAHLPPPSAAQCGVLRQLVCAGFCDRVARLRRVQEPNAGTPNGPPLLYDTVLGAEQLVDVRSTQTGTVEEREAREARQLDGVAVHPASIVRRCEPPPEFVVYTELLRTEKRTWMRGCTVVEARWLAALLGPFVQFGAPLELPRPHYQRELDSVVCHVSPTVAPIGWPLPPCERPMPESRERCRWFAVALLRGDVCPALAPLAERLTSAPALAVRPHVPASKAALIAALAAAGIATRAQLDDSWRRVPSFLLGEYLAWLERDCHDAIKAAWPPTDDTLELELPPMRSGAAANEHD